MLNKKPLASLFDFAELTIPFL